MISLWIYNIADLFKGELFEGREEEFDKFENLLKNWQRELHPVERFYDEAAPILGNEPHLVELLKQWIPRAFKHGMCGYRFLHLFCETKKISMNFSVES